MNQLIRVNKNGHTFLLHCTAQMDPAHIVDTVDHVDVHYKLESDRGERELKANGIVRLKENEVIVINL